MAKYFVNYLDKRSHINKNIYGHFSEHLGRCIYGGLWVGKDSDIPNINGVRKDIIDALKAIRIPLLRWPGGFFSDVYHWKDGVGPQSERKPVLVTMWGGVVEDNSFGTHEFFDMCEEIGCGTYLAGNLASGTVEEMSDWVEYVTGTGHTKMADWRRRNGREKPWKIDVFGVGNECWGDGQMLSSYYCDLYRRYSSYLGGTSYGDAASRDKMQLIAVGPNHNEFDWMDDVAENLTNPPKCMALAREDVSMLDGISLHRYTTSKGNMFKSKTARDFDEYEWYELLSDGAAIEDVITRNDSIMTQFDPEKKLGLAVDEWGAWHRAEEGSGAAFCFQQNTMRDAVLAAFTLNIFNKHSDRINLATIAQMVNVIHSIILTENEKMVLTPTYYVFDMFKDHMDATLLGSFIEKRKVGIEEAQVDNLFESASVDADGNILCTICNTSYAENEVIDCELAGACAKGIKAELLTSEDPHDINSFDAPNTIKTVPYKAEITDSGFRCVIPAHSVVSVHIQIA